MSLSRAQHWNPPWEPCEASLLSKGDTALTQILWVIREPPEAQEISEHWSTENKAPLENGPLDVEACKPEHWNFLACLQLRLAPLSTVTGCLETQD